MFLLDYNFTRGRGAKYSNQLSLCLSVSPLTYLKNHFPDSQYFQCMLSMAVAQSFCDDSAVLCTSSCVDYVMLAHSVEAPTTQIGCILNLTGGGGAELKVKSDINECLVAMMSLGVHNKPKQVIR